MFKPFFGLFHTKITMTSLSVRSILLGNLLPQRLVADNDMGRDIQSRLYVAAIRTDVGLSGKIMVPVYDEQLVVVAGDGAHDWGIVIVLPF